MIRVRQLPNGYGAPRDAAPWKRFAGDRWSATQTIVRLTDAILSRVPAGYEDEGGFHRGEPPAPKQK
jgi:hypothetical protein